MWRQEYLIWKKILDVHFRDVAGNFIFPRQKYFYGVKPSIAESQKNTSGPRDLFGAIWWDCPYGIRLNFLWQTIACLGFTVKDEKTLRIEQLQGVLGKREYLKGLRWERMLIRLLIKVAPGLGYEKIYVQPGKNNRWVGNDLKTFKLRYDVSAKREGFKYDPENGDYVLKLT
ncbi:hypothetical protein A2303_02945 [Candidatus Falkowbacteria bacterium RIFOXYB2_FULL_47_14]|uniref:Uncharacterized protein n=1 Tax=Candidatus Falkowbacteria bacterium RIFOXYA2_FULL_47_19 TaxID=1797994 RepID=A0A1F5SLP4_9BACT|nr:MAG: hypothetical protein A2227_02020 [Candidatus Falkowbacteria bacterium RIFOXYA2_FULL_47_19]OGF36273.1 MAG: hypothetical protein A2468_07690 [Candidatus Falkowbacteria bacterium RIFOXYC2_FULL_46_15]OGF43077.1 MAG: hypothetical protein A2303_02945 [Candidatus Falkowbacteria bacterium RIFOXYB2_FULL_47_14]